MNRLDSFSLAALSPSSATGIADGGELALAGGVLQRVGEEDLHGSVARPYMVQF